jgi:hypothetical protein
MATIPVLSPISGLPIGHPASGKVLLPSNMLNGTTQALSAAQSGTCWFLPYDIGPTGLTPSNVYVQTSIAQSGGGSTSLTGSIYDDDGTGGTPKLSSGPRWTFGSGWTLTATAGFLAVAHTTFIPPGRYWVAVLYIESSAPGTRASVYRVTDAAPPTWLTSGSTFSVARGFSMTGQSAFPTSGTLVTNQTAASGNPIVGIKAA